MPASSDILAWVDGRLVPVDKLAAHRRGLLHPAISVFVLRGDEILLQQRAAGKYHSPLLWANTVCTHPHVGEDDLTCAIRRLDEEMGIRGLTPTLRGRVTYRADVGQGLTEHEDVAIFTAHAPADLRVAPNPDEVAATHWMSLDALNAARSQAPWKFTPWLNIYLDQHLQSIFGNS
ncbi:isopentenyl-diphosphate delta-isomerase [Ketogulonicigenium robustum]|uniref:Isopentenyl-diphosphate Delta-isomerase n=1 Tax=Ketogulonicigenium robustum TaxID=92947 RepID=A0A1W6NX64_9RHOB|nr:NUDIX domain-containing protein [Ketogulonicigenium robustum]ARO13690.1 isopentenyl-diphosphate delta-isomerase [Ketogulonicigenium robustum]